MEDTQEIKKIGRGQTLIA